jgi:hypothetical protein
MIQFCLTKFLSFSIHLTYQEAQMAKKKGKKKGKKGKKGKKKK